MSNLNYGLDTDTSEKEQTTKTTASQVDRPSPPVSASKEASDEPTVLSKDVIFDILKNQRRRLILEFLRNHRTTTLSDLAEHVAAVENEKEIQRLTSSERKRVYVGLYQCHLPKLGEARLVDYDPERNTVELRETSSQVYPYLDLDQQSGMNRRGIRGWRSLLTSLLKGR